MTTTTKLPGPKTLAAMMRAKRVAKGLRADFVASRMGISKSHLSRLEGGSRAWTDALVRKFLVAIGDDNKHQNKT